jgi:aspartyl-tRNA(Asn)/glutamyl-tRNA(Gln) amidotransferase subunit B
LRRFVDSYGLTLSDAQILTEEPDVADYYEQVVRLADGRSDDAAKWVTGEVFALARTRGGISEAQVDPGVVAELITLVAAGEITLRTAKEVFADAATSGESPASIVAARGLGQVRDTDLIGAVAREVIAEHPDAVADYRAGKTQALGFLIGQAMRKLRGAGNPDIVRTELVRILDSDGE